jgi:RimJ/RimL family protein N-acetyltransferase
MATYPRKVRLRSGQEVTLRPPTRDDEQALHAFFNALLDEDRMFLKDDVTDRAVIRRWLESPDPDRIFPLLAVSEGRVVADATLHRNAHAWSRHVGEIRMVIARDWQRQGLAAVLTHELVAAASERGIDIIEARVLEGQHGAQVAMERLGFEVDVVLRNRATDRTGRRRSVVIMTRDVAELWRRMADMMQDLEFDEASRH